MTYDTLAFLIFWGVWILVPILIDGLTTLVNLLGGWWARRQQETLALADRLDYYPLVSILVPVYNGAHTLTNCLRALKNQTYPSDRLEIILINNGSTDRTFTIFNELQNEPFSGALNWVSLPQRGKSFALNAGIHVARGSLIFNIDADTVLHPDAVLNMVRAFEAHPDLGSATGAIHVLAPEQTDASITQKILTACEYLEYLASFQVGRVYQTLNQSLYTLAGAFSAFRREVLLGTFLYDARTVTEDTDLTFELHQRVHNARIACVPEAIGYVHPIAGWRALYSQRVRWQRGQLEVMGWHANLLRRTNLWRVKGLSPQRLLLTDHTLSFPRLAWLFFFPALVGFGYPLDLIVNATLATYAFYALMEGAWQAMIYAVSDTPARARLRQTWWTWLAMPAYRFLLFWFRLAGALAAQADPPLWRVVDPATATRQGLVQITQAAQHVLNSIRQPHPVTSRDPLSR